MNTPKIDQTASSESPSVPGSSSSAEQLEKSIRAAYSKTLEALNYEGITKSVAYTVEELKSSAAEQLGAMLNRFPNVTRSIGKGWHIHLLRVGHGGYQIEMYYPIAWSAELIFDHEKILEAGEHGLIDENGVPVANPPCCPTCPRKNAQG